MAHLRYIRAKGTAFERGEIIGRHWRNHIPAVLKGLDRASRTEGGMPLGDWLPHARKFRPFIEQYADRTLAEMQGMAAGAGVPFDDMLLLTCIYEKHFKHFAAEHCTGFAARGAATRSGELITGQTNDEAIQRWAAGQWDAVVHHIQASGMQTLIYTHPGVPAYMGMNSAGLCVLWMAIDNHERAPGLPTNVLLRELLRFDALRDAVRYLEDVPRSLPNNYLFSHPDEGICNVESFPSRVCPTYRDDMMYHANHILDPEMAVNDCKNDYPENSTFFRFQAMGSLLEQHAGRIDAATARLMLSDHSHYPRSICAHPHVDSFDAKTLASVIFQPLKGRMQISFGNGCEVPYQTVAFID